MSTIGDSKPTILFVAVPGTLGGSNRSLTTLMSAMGGVAHRVLAAPSSGPFVTFAIERGAIDDHLALPHGNRLKRIAAGIVIARWIWLHRDRLSSIHAQALTGLNLVTLGAAIARIPVVVRVSDPVSSRWGRIVGPLIRTLVRDLRVAPVSDVARDVAVMNRLCRTEEALVVPNPVDAEEVVSNQRGPKSSSAMRVGFLGGPTHRKGWDVLLAVIELTLHRDLKWNLFISPDRVAGDARLKSFPPGRVQVRGRLTDVREAYAMCDVVFVPSRAESFCRVVAEAMANAIPVVASDLPPIRALVGDQEAGLLFEPGNPGQAATLLEKIHGDAELRAALGRAGKRRVASLSPRVIATKLAPLYGLEAIGGSASTAPS